MNFSANTRRLVELFPIFAVLFGALKAGEFIIWLNVYAANAQNSTNFRFLDRVRLYLAKTKTSPQIFKSRGTLDLLHPGSLTTTKKGQNQVLYLSGD